MTLNDFLGRIGHDTSLEFEDCMQVINEHYAYSPTAFSNGSLRNEAGQNEGSCKIFAFARLHGLDEARTLACFGRFYRDVLNTPDGSDHGNIRNFMRSGWPGIHFEQDALTAKA